VAGLQPLASMTSSSNASARFPSVAFLCSTPCPSGPKNLARQAFWSDRKGNLLVRGSHPRVTLEGLCRWWRAVLGAQIGAQNHAPRDYA
jgi:hypothetical protein